MTTDNKTLADVQPGGRVRLGNQAERARFEAFLSGNPLIALSAGTAWQVWQAALSAQPSPGGQGDAWDIAELVRTDLDRQSCPDAYMRIAMESVVKHLAARQPVETQLGYTLSDVHEAYSRGKRDAARQPVGELHLPPDGFYKIVFDDAEVPDESFARSGALDAALRRFEQISNKWNAHLFVRFANNTRDCTVPNATPAQAVDLGAIRDAVQGITLGFDGDLPYIKGIAEALTLIDSPAVGNGN